MEQLKLEEICDRLAIIDVILQFARSLDTKDWELCRSCFADTVDADYSDLRGTPAATLSADEFVELRRQALSHLITQHFSTNHFVTINGTEATCTSNAIIYRYLPDQFTKNRFDTHCTYVHTLIRTSEGWKISKVKQIVLWNEGNPEIHGAEVNG